MAYNFNYQVASPQQLIREIGQQLEQLRLGMNLSQSTVAIEAGVSRRTITRMEAGETVSLDTFVRVLKVYGVADRLAMIFPEHNVRPIERVKRGGKQRKRASSARESSKQAWSWSDDVGDGSTEND